MTKYRLDKHHEQVFGHNDPLTSDEIYLKVFGDPLTDAIESQVWRKQYGHLVRNIDISDLSNYCGKDEMEAMRARDKHKEIFENIRKEGIKTPLVAAITSSYEIVVKEGHHRVAIAKMLGMESVPVFLLVEDNGKTAR